MTMYKLGLYKRFELFESDRSCREVAFEKKRAIMGDSTSILDKVLVDNDIDANV